MAPGSGPRLLYPATARHNAGRRRARNGVEATTPNRARNAMNRLCRKGVHRWSTRHIRIAPPAPALAIDIRPFDVLLMRDPRPIRTRRSCLLGIDFAAPRRSTSTSVPICPVHVNWPRKASFHGRAPCVRRNGAGISPAASLRSASAAPAHRSLRRRKAGGRVRIAEPLTPAAPACESGGAFRCAIGAASDEVCLRFNDFSFPVRKPSSAPLLGGRGGRQQRGLLGNIVGQREHLDRIHAASRLQVLVVSHDAAG